MNTLRQKKYMCSNLKVLCMHAIRVVPPLHISCVVYFKYTSINNWGERINLSEGQRSENLILCSEPARSIFKGAWLRYTSLKAWTGGTHTLPPIGPTMGLHCYTPIELIDGL